MTFELESTGPSFTLPFEFPVAGTGFDRRASAIRRYAKRGLKVRLEREPTNAHDPNAIAVILCWKNKVGAALEEPIGYVPASLAEEMTELMHARKLRLTKTEVLRVRADDGDDWPKVTVQVDGELGDGVQQTEFPL
jgi:hypothetical protein